LPELVRKINIVQNDLSSSCIFQRDNINFETIDIVTISGGGGSAQFASFFFFCSFFPRWWLLFLLLHKIHSTQNYSKKCKKNLNPLPPLFTCKHLCATSPVLSLISSERRAKNNQ